MIHLLAVLSLVAAVVVWYLVQRWAASEPRRACGAEPPDCESCEERDSGCAPASRAPAALRRPPGGRLRAEQPR